MTTLVVYYSLNQHTATVGVAIAARLGATTAVIEEESPRRGALGLATGAAGALLGRPSAIRDGGPDPAGFDLVILGTPVWVGAPAPAVNAYIGAHRDALKQVAFFATQAKSGAAQAFARMERRLGHPPLATLELAEDELAETSRDEKVARFLSDLGFGGTP
jgi:flavodoxin